MKDNNNVIGGRLRPDKYQAYAEYLSMYVRGYKDHHGLDIYAISLANEPDITVKYSSCNWTGQEFHDFLKILIPVFERDKVAAKVVVGEHSAWTENPVLESIEDPATAARVDIVGVHAYGVVARVAFPPVTQRSGLLVETNAKKKKIWQTEAANLGKNYSDIHDGVYWAKVVHTHVAENRTSGWFYWWLVSQYPDSGGSLVHLDLQKKTYTVDKRLFTIGNFSRFVRPGYYRVEMSPDAAPGVFVSAYKSEAERQLVLVAINENDTPQDLELKLTGITATSAVPYRTSATEDIAKLPPIAIAENALKVSLPPVTVTTFVASAAPAQ
jgi:glucuronoarabinoxylan endo-1,4-beta-xylanase